MTNVLLAKVNDDITTWSTSLLVLGVLLAIIATILFVVTVIWMITWIKYSWLHRENSANLTGATLATKYLTTYGVNARRIKFRGFNSIICEPKFFYLNPYLCSNSYFRLRLLPWTYHRRSLYSLATAMESTWTVSSSKINSFNTFWWDFARKITLLFVLIPFILSFLFAFSPKYAWITLSPNNADMLSILLSIFGSVLLILFSIMQMTFYSKVRREICQNLVGILTKNEIRIINWIFQIKFVYYLIRMFYEILQFMLRLVLYRQNQKR